MHRHLPWKSCLGSCRSQGVDVREWTDSTWNPVTGCTKISPGCQFCYAELITDKGLSHGLLNLAERGGSGAQHTAVATVVKIAEARA